MLLLDYSIKTSTIDNGKPYWNYTLCEIYKGEEKIGEYKRTYPSFAKETFFAFSFKGKDYALYSANYTKIQLMSLPDCQEIPLKEECVKQTANFCPTELYLPIWANTTYEYNGKKSNIQQWINTLKKELNDDYHYEYGYCHLALATGCVWGDDSSWKLMLIDLRKIDEGEIWFVDNRFERKWLYEEFPDSCKLKDVEFEFEDDEFSFMPSGYKQLVQKLVWFPSDIETGDELIELEIEYELEVHDCGQNPNCSRYRSCGNDVKPLPSEKKLEKLKEIFTKRLKERNFDDKFIADYIKEKWG
jgi:hypothetical protein